MKSIILRPRYALGLWLLAMLCASASAQEEGLGAAAPSLVTAEVLEAKIAEVESASEIEEEAKTKLVELYRKALGNLQLTTSYADAAMAFQGAAETASAEIQAFREEMDESSVADPADTLEVEPSAPLPRIEQTLQQEKADLAAADAERADFKKRLREEADRPVLIRQRLTEAKREQEEVAAQIKLAPPADESSALTQARRWVLETRGEMLSSEIKALDQELLSQPMRVDLLKTKREEAAVRVVRIRKRVNMLEELVNRKRQAEAEQARAHAEASQREAEGKHPLVAQLAQQNATLSSEVADMVVQLGQVTEEVESADRLARQVEEDFKGARDTIEIGGLSQDLGHMLLQQRQSLPDLRSFRRQTEDRENRAAEIGLRRLSHRREQKRLRDPEAYVSGIAGAEPAEDTLMLHQQLGELAMERKALLEQAVESDDDYLRELGELESIQQRLLETIEAYDAFLDEHLLWVRSTSQTQLQELGALPEQVWRIISPSGWLEVGRVLGYQATHSPAFVLLALALGILLWGRRRLIRMVQAMSDRVGKPPTDRFVFSLQALALTLIVAVVLPLAFAVTGWQLKVSLEATEFTSAVGASLVASAAQFFALRALRMICIPDGLASAHFRWPESSLQLFRKELDRLTWIYLPAYLVSVIAFYLDPLNVGWAIGRAAFVIMVGALGFAFYRLLHPKSGLLASYTRQPDRATFRRLYRLWYPLLVAAPLALGALSLMGYVYTAGILAGLLLRSTWMIVGLVIVYALARRWLLVTRRHLAYEAAMERRALEEAEKKRGKEDSGDPGVLYEVDEEEVDLVALSDTSRKLVLTIIVFAGVVGLWLIWSEVFPALRYFDEVPLWHRAVRLDGAEQFLPVTLADIGLALVYLVVTLVLAKQLPAVLEILLLDYAEMSAGNRYTVTTLTTYTVITVGIVLVFGMIGVDWSKLQWLVAALGVGIGFGLQEIVANFISGLILLFERPIRIGDFVSVGGTDGVVTRIRIRATTIRNPDGKELLVPNKAFITGNLLNWSLSDQTTRILISVGIAYGSDVREAMRLLEEAARENEVVMDDPAPSVIFQAFADSSLTMLLRCFVDSVDVRFSTISALNQAINDKFNAAGIVIAFPQRDLHLDTIKPLRVQIEHTGPTTE
jgi:potassium efflux system protein